MNHSVLSCRLRHEFLLRCIVWWLKHQISVLTANYEQVNKINRVCISSKLSWEHFLIMLTIKKAYTFIKNEVQSFMTSIGIYVYDFILTCKLMSFTTEFSK